MPKRPTRFRLRWDAFSAHIRTYRIQIAIILSLVAAVSILFPGGRSLQYTYQVNDIAREPVIAPFNFPILKTEEKLKSDLNEALKSEPYLFERNQERVNAQIEAIGTFFKAAVDIRKARLKLQHSKDLMYRYRYTDRYQETHSLVSSDSAALAVLLNQFRAAYPFASDNQAWAAFLQPVEETGPKFNLTQFQNDIIQICRSRWAEGIYDIPLRNIASYEVAVSSGDVPTLGRPIDFNDLETAWTKAKVEITGLYPEDFDVRRDMGYDLIVEFMKPNLIYNKEVTERRQKARLDRVPRFQGMVLQDERIVDANTRITTDILQKLNSLSIAVAQKERLERGLDILLAFLGRILLVGVVVSFFFSFLLTYRTSIFRDWKLVLLIALIFLVEHGLTYVLVVRMGQSEYVIPITVAAMVLTILFDARVGFMAATSIAMLSGIIIGNHLDFVIVTLFISSAAVYSVRRLRTRSQLFTAIFALSTASLLVITGIGLFKAYPWHRIGEDMVYLLALSVLAPIVTYGLIGLLEIGFGISTDLTLLELSDFNHPLLKRLQQEANGTFNHSVIVGNLAEACANAIGARSLLCRVGAYYHDIGKMSRPEYFIENQVRGQNKHDTLTPVMSAKIVRNHVKEGLQLAEEYGLPQVVSDFIPMHHGTSRIDYFYHKATSASPNDEVDENAFRYPGPKPNTKETGILMICEAVEAAIRSIKDPDLFKIEEMIDRIIDKRITDGQLNECPLTIDELRRIKGDVTSTVGMLQVIRGIYHIRVEYPDEKPAAA